MTPHLLTIDGVAEIKSIVSNIILIWLFILIISPLLKHNFLLSSKTVFKFYAQIESMGPSKINHLRALLCDFTNFLNLQGSKPSTHSLDTSSYCPYNSFNYIDLGFILILSTPYSFYSPLHLFNTYARTCKEEVLPEYGLPTNIMPCLVNTV